jgi:hypothetical protein
MRSLSRTQSLIFEEPPQGLHLLSQGEVTYFFEVPRIPLIKEDGRP